MLLYGVLSDPQLSDNVLRGVFDPIQDIRVVEAPLTSRSEAPSQTREVGLFIFALFMVIACWACASSRLAQLHPEFYIIPASA